MANANADHERSEAESRRAITISQGQVTRRRNQFLFLYEGQADRAELIEAKGRFNVASDALGSDLAAYALTPDVDLGADYYVTHHHYWRDTRQEIQGLYEEALTRVPPGTTESAPPGVFADFPFEGDAIADPLVDVNAPPPPTPRAAATVPPLPDPGGTTPAGPSQPHGLRGGLTPRRSPAPSESSSSNSNRSSQTTTGSDGSQADLPDDASRHHAGTNVDAPPPPNPGAAATVPPRPDPGGTTPTGPSQPHGSRGGLTPRRSPAPSDRSSSNSNWSGQRAGGSDASRPGVTNDVLNRRVVTNVNAPPPPTLRPAATVPPLPDPGGTVPARPSEPLGPRGGPTPRRTAAPTDRSTSNSNRSGQGAAGS